ncbi:MAG: poly-beta-hydroxybutyrate polymerase, partial [Paracoccaceae bacterium]
MTMSPGKQLHLMQQAFRNGHTLCAASFGVNPPGETPDSASDPAADTGPDRRFAGEGWQKYPFNHMSRAHQQNWQWRQNAMTNSEVIAATRAEHGQNLLRGAKNLAGDVACKTGTGQPPGPQPFEV